MSGREIALQAVGLLLEKGYDDAVKKLSQALANKNTTYIVLSLGDVDWKISSALEQIGGWECISVVASSHGCLARFYFNKEY